MRHRFHVLGLAHTITTREYSACAFTQKVLKLCAMLHRRGHEVIHYGNESSEVECSEAVSVVSARELAEAYPGWDWRTQGFPDYDLEDPVYAAFNERATREIARRKRAGDFLLCMFGYGHRAVADAHPDLLVVEPGIGYGGGFFAPYKVFESYALLHAYLGIEKVAHCSNDKWYDVVIPNYFDPGDFTFSEEKDDYLLHIGRLGEGKGTHIAAEVAARAGRRLVVAGPGDPPPGCEYVGVVGPARRAELMSRAAAVICPSTYVEPFCGVQVEAMLSGTPVISTDWGAFAEINVEGVTGFRCRTLRQFLEAVDRLWDLSPAEIRAHGMRYSMESIYPMYERYFDDVRAVLDGAGWYA